MRGFLHLCCLFGCVESQLRHVGCFVADSVNRLSCSVACRILVPPPGLIQVPCIARWILNHRTIRQDLTCGFYCNFLIEI